MAINISGLQAYVKHNPDLLTTTIYKESIVQRFSDIKVYDRETPGPYRYRIFDPIANPGACCRVPDGESTITERDTNIICILDGQEYCETDLAAILRDATFRFTAGMESAGSIEEVITRGQINAFVQFIDKLIFQGDTAASPETFKGQSLADGLLKIGTTEGTVVTATAEEDMYSLIRRSIQSLNNNARRQGRIAVFVGEEVGDSLQSVYIDMNKFHFNPGTYTAYSENQLIGFANVVVVPTPGLTGTNKMLITPLNNIVYFTNRMGDIETLDWDYTKYHKKYYWRIETIFGIDLALPEYSVVVNYTAANLTNPYCPCAVEVTPAP